MIIGWVNSSARVVWNLNSCVFRYKSAANKSCSKREECGRYLTSAVLVIIGIEEFFFIAVSKAEEDFRNPSSLA